ncbi:MAG: GNAT family N-acetyltransferase [Neptuniibacter sp.]
MEFRFKIQFGDNVPVTQLQRFYKRNGHKGKIQPNDRCAWLSEDDEIIAAVRLSPSPQADSDYLQLKGLWVAKALRGQGIGGVFLDRLSDFLMQSGKPCYCLAYDHLENFYQSHKFIPISKDDAPDSLWQRLQRYQSRGNQLKLMQFKPE